MRNVILHYHIFKNAGSSIDRLLQDHFGTAWQTLEGETPTDVLSSSRVGKYLEAHPEIEALSSHLARPPVPDGVCTFPIVFLRNPIDRAASVYSHEHRIKPNVKSAEIANVRDFRGYVRWCFDEHEGRREGGNVIRNYQVIHLSSASFRTPQLNTAEAEECDLREAVAFLEAIPFFGIVEEFGVSLALLQRLALPYWPSFRVVDTKENSSPDRSQPFQLRMQVAERDLGADMWDRFATENRLDFELYTRAVGMFQKRAAQYGLSPRA